MGGKLYGHGTGRSKKEAEQQAAETAYGAISEERPAVSDPATLADQGDQGDPGDPVADPVDPAS